MKWVKTLIAFIVVLGVGAYIYFYERKAPTTEEWKEKENKVFDFKSEDVIKLSLKKDERLIVCEKKEEEWQMVKPLNVKASKGEIDKVLSRLEFLQDERKIKEEEDKKLSLKGFGFDKPGIEVILELKDKSFNLLLGDDCPVGGNMYVMHRGGEEVRVVRKSLFDDLDKKVDDLRERQVIEVDKYNVTKLLIEREESILECKKENEKWHITNPLSVRCDTDKIDEIFDKLDELKVEEFVSEDTSQAEKFGLSSPEFTVTVWEKDTARSLIFGRKEKDKVYVKRKAFDSIYSVEKDILEKLVVEANELRDKKIVRFDSEKVKKLTVERGGKKYVCEKDSEDNWKLVEPAGVELNTSTVDNILWDISGLDAEKFVVESAKSLAKYGLTKPKIKLTIEIKEGEEEKILLVGKKADGDNFYAKLKRREEIFEISGSIVENFKKDFEKKSEESVEKDDEI